MGHWGGARRLLFKPHCILTRCGTRGISSTDCLLLAGTSAPWLISRVEPCLRLGWTRDTSSLANTLKKKTRQTRIKNVLNSSISGTVCTTLKALKLALAHYTALFPHFHCWSTGPCCRLHNVFHHFLECLQAQHSKCVPMCCACPLRAVLCANSAQSHWRTPFVLTYSEALAP